MTARYWLLGLVVLLLAGATYVLAPRENSSTPTTNPEKNTSAYFYPMTRYASRITNRDYGKKITPSDSQSLPCGAPFSGLHTGDDLEVNDDELNTDVPVYAIADGTVRQVSNVGGYGGLLVIQHSVNNQTVTAYYGHVSLAKTTVKAGERVKAGQQVSVLGKACSAETSNERKHLHFAIHAGTDIDVKGYVQTQASLTAWRNPKETLANLGASEPS